MADALGLSGGLSGAMAPTRQRRSAHDPGRVVVDLAVMVADGCTSLSELKVLRHQPELFGSADGHWGLDRRQLQPWHWSSTYSRARAPVVSGYVACRVSR
jgi:hypothetical protein